MEEGQPLESIILARMLQRNPGWMDGEMVGKVVVVEGAGGRNAGSLSALKTGRMEEEEEDEEEGGGGEGARGGSAVNGVDCGCAGKQRAEGRKERGRRGGGEDEEERRL